MPHIILEYSANLHELPSFNALFADIHQVLNREGGIKLENCKSRARIANDYYIADGHPKHAFIHLSIEFVKGRTREIKQAIGQECLKLVKDYYQAQISDHLQITVLIDDIELDFYFKHPEGSLSYQDILTNEKGR
jgi:5-carboxymethyl-2-hydroxymuconate isomerase